jgi:hypothetical protein
MVRLSERARRDHVIHRQLFDHRPGWWACQHPVQSREHDQRHSSLFSNNPKLLESLGAAGTAGLAAGFSLFDSNQSLPFQSNQTGAATVLQHTGQQEAIYAGSAYSAGLPLAAAFRR